MKASLHIRTGLNNGITFLQDAFFTPPFKVADITLDRRSPTLQLMLMSASPGVLDGDEYDLRFNIAAGCSLRVQTQSYQRLFSMKGKALQQVEVNMEAGSSLFFLPHPVVPHKGADFSVTNTINLSGNCVLCWGEVVTCGRKLNGELFQYTRYHNVTKIYRCNKLVLKENLLLQPAGMPVDEMGGLEGYTHMASLVYLDENAGVKEMMAAVNHFLGRQTGMIYGASAAPVNGFTVRLLGNKAEQLYDCLLAITGMLPAQPGMHTGNQ